MHIEVGLALEHMSGAIHERLNESSNPQEFFHVK